MAQSTPAEETQVLLSYLNAQRDHVLGILDGLDEDDLRRPVLPSGWTCLGLVQHLALDVERFWFRAVVAGEQAGIDGLAEIGNAWEVSAEVPAGDVLDRYREEIDRANAVIAATPLDAAPAWWPEDQFGNWRVDSLREIVLHVMTETACHAGHLDAVRELIDRRLWLVLTE
ncbi:MAG TPA: DinB family protein [Thermomicrobiales bacterium]